MATLDTSIEAAMHRDQDIVQTSSEFDESIVQSAIEAISSNPFKVYTPRLRIREPLDTELTEADLLLHILEAQAREQMRTSNSNANSVPYPVPMTHEVFVKLKHMGPLTPELVSFYSRFGTWEVPFYASYEKLQLRIAAPMQLRAPADDGLLYCFEDGSSASQEDIWQCIIKVKMAERHVWGCFDSAPFPLTSPCTVTGTMIAADASSFRSSMHQDDSGMVTCLDVGSSAWEMLPLGVVNVFARDDWEVNAAGGFCLRETDKSQNLKTICPSADWECVICLSDADKNVVVAKCGHAFHSYCIRRWFTRSSKCPLCRRRCRLGPATISPPMDFEVEQWPMLPDGVIAQDATTWQQMRLQNLREALPLSTAAMQARRRKLSDRFRCKAPEDSFFLEISATDDSIGAAVVLERSRRHSKEVEAIRNELEARGRNFVVWPVNGRWCDLPMDSQTLARRCALTASLAARHPSLAESASSLTLVLKRRIAHDITRCILKQCYQKAPSQGEESRFLAQNILRCCYERDDPAGCPNSFQAIPEVPLGSVRTNPKSAIAQEACWRTSEMER